MALSRAKLLVLLIPCPVVVLLSAALKGVNAAECLASAEAVRQEYPGAWPSWTMQAADHKGTKCWFPATREDRGHRSEAVPRKYAAELQRIAPDARAEAAQDTEDAEDAAPASTDEMNELGWSFHSRTLRIGALRDDPGADSSFDDRFAAAFDGNSLGRPSTLQYMMVQSGNLP
jgi:hypothetical protein